MRRSTVLLSVVLAALGLVAVGSAAPTAGDPDWRPAKADMARAKSATLRASDVYSNFTRSSSASHLPTIAHCDGYPGNRSNITITGEAKSAFSFRSYSIGSTVLWFKTVADANRYWTSTARSQYVGCRAKGLAIKRASGETVKPHISQAARIALDPTGAEKAVAYRVVGGVPSTPGAGNDSFNYIDTTAFIKHGRSVAILRTVWITNPCDCYHELARTLATRIKTASRA